MKVSYNLIYLVTPEIYQGFSLDRIIYPKKNESCELFKLSELKTNGDIKENLIPKKDSVIFILIDGEKNNKEKRDFLMNYLKRAESKNFKIEIKENDILYDDLERIKRGIIRKILASR